MSKQICLILFGAPGSGKGTQAKLLSESLKLVHISTGDMLRERVALDDELGREAAAIMRTGALVPDEIVNRMVEDRIAQPDCVTGFIFDGYPRTLNQAELFLAVLRLLRIDPWVINLKVDYNVIVARIAGRRECPVCGSIYNVASAGGVCPKDGSTLVIRDDDREDVVRARLWAFEERTAPVLEYLRNEGCAVFDVDAQAAPDVVARRIGEWVGARAASAVS